MTIPASASRSSYGGYTFNWSPAEKKLAREAFERALKNELDDLITETKRRADRIQTPDQIWDLVEHLLERRKQINARYDYRYSVLPMVFASLLRSGRLAKRDLDGLREDKLAEIRRLSESEG